MNLSSVFQHKDLRNLTMNNSSFNSNNSNSSCYLMSRSNSNNDIDLNYLHEELLIVDTISKWLLVVCIVLSLISNTFVVFCNLKSQSPNPYRQLILNLAICDLVYTFMQIFKVHSRFNMHVWHFGRFFCKAMSLSPSSLTSAMFTMTFMAIERFITIVYPFRPRLGKRMIFSAVGMLWIVATAVHLPSFLYRDTVVDRNGNVRCRYTSSQNEENMMKSYRLVSFTLTYPIPVVIIVVSSINIIYTTLSRVSRRRQSLRIHMGGAARERHVNPLKKYKKLFIMFTCILVSFIVTTTPNQALILWMNFAPKDNLPFRSVRFTFFMLYAFAPLVHLHTIINPLIYSFSDEKFRTELRQLVTSIWSNVVPRREEKRLLSDSGHTRKGRNMYESPSLIQLSTKTQVEQSEKDTFVRKKGSSEDRNCPNITTTISAT